MLVVDYEAIAHDVSWRCQADTIKTILTARVLAPYKRDVLWFATRMMQTFKRLYEPLCEPPMGPSRKLGQASVWGGLGCDLQDKK